MDPQALKILAQCPVCLEVKRNVPIYQCTNGHIICGPCKERSEIGQQCPTGRCPFDTPPRRNRQVERIIEEADFEFTCRYASEGCEFSDHREELTAHEEKECDFRPIKCGFLNCGKVFKARDIPKHLLQAHLSCKYAMNGCEFTGTRGHLLWHEDECVFRMVECPDGHCEYSIKVIEVLDHIKVKHKNAIWVGSAGKDPSDDLGIGSSSTTVIRGATSSVINLDSHLMGRGSSSDTEMNEISTSRLITSEIPSSSSRLSSRRADRDASRRHTTTVNLSTVLAGSGSNNGDDSDAGNVVTSSSSSNSTGRVLTCKWDIKDLKFQRNWGLVIHEQDDLLFFGQLQKGSDGLFYIWLQTLGSKRVATNYRCDLELRGKDTIVKHRSKVFPIDLSKEEVRWDSQCFQASERLLRQCVDRGQQMRQQELLLQRLSNTSRSKTGIAEQEPSSLVFEAKFTLHVNSGRNRAAIASGQGGECAQQ